MKKLFYPEFVCTRCSKTKGLNAFNRDNASPTGYRRTCRTCDHERYAQWKQKRRSKSTRVRPVDNILHPHRQILQQLQYVFSLHLSDADKIKLLRTLYSL